MRKLFAKWEKRCPFGPITPVVSAACRVVSACFSPVLLALQAPYYYLYTESLHKAFAPIIDGVPNSICWGSGISALSIGEWLHAWVDIFVDHVYFYELDYTAFDSTVNKYALKAENRIMQWVQMPPDVAESFQRQQRLTAVGPGVFV
jgi:hypothetical protein